MRDARGVSVIENSAARSAAGVSPAAQAARLHRHGDRVAGARHRRQHRDLPAAERAQPAHAAGARAARARRGAVDRRRPRRPAHRPQPADLAAAIRRAAAAAAGVLDRCSRSATRASTCRAAGEVRYVEGLWVSGKFFETLGVTPAVGRLIGPADDRERLRSRVAVISYALWQSEFGGRADILGQSIPGAGHRGADHRRHVARVLRRRSRASVRRRRCRSARRAFTRRDHWWLAAIGRLKPGWTRAQAQAHAAGHPPGRAARHDAGDYPRRLEPHLREDARRPRRCVAPASRRCAVGTGGRCGS